MPSPVLHEGDKLRRAREARGLTVAEVAAVTRIPAKFIVALEDEAPQEEFPAPVYARAYLRTYARHLELDPEPLLRSFEARVGAPAEPTVRPLAALVPPKPRRRGWAALVFLSLVALAVLIGLRLAAEKTTMGGAIGPGVPPAASASPVPSPSQSATRSPEAQGGGPVRATAIRVRITATEPCWILAQADGSEPFSPRTFQPGETVRLTGRHTVSLRLGNAGGVHLLVNGKPVTTGASGEVVDLAFALQRGRVVPVA